MSKEVKEFFSTYSDFVAKVTSEPSLDLEALKESLQDIEKNSPVKSARLLTAALGQGLLLVILLILLVNFFQYLASFLLKLLNLNLVHL